MGLKCGIVGLPNVGKSTLFNALTGLAIDIANYPFCTISPNVGVVQVPDERLNILSDIVKPQAIIPTLVEFVDIAGLVAGASKGEGLGNQFLANIKETDAILNMVRCFADDNIIHVNNQVDPLSDVQTIATELALADLETVNRAITREAKLAKSFNKQAIAMQALLQDKILPALNEGQAIRTLALSEDEKALLKPLCLLTIKPCMYVANVSEDHYNSTSNANEYLQKLSKLASSEGAPLVTLCAKFEAEIATLDDVAKQEFLLSINQQQPGLNRLVSTAYDLLNLHTYFTAGVKELRAWTIKKGAKAPEAAGVIHSDFERGFIKAQVVSYDDYVAYKGEQGAQSAGKLRLEGKDYVVMDGDIMHFRFNV